MMKKELLLILLMVVISPVLAYSQLIMAPDSALRSDGPVPMSFDNRRLFPLVEQIQRGMRDLTNSEKAHYMDFSSKIDKLVSGQDSLSSRIDTIAGSLILIDKAIESIKLTEDSLKIVKTNTQDKKNAVSDTPLDVLTALLTTLLSVFVFMIWRGYRKHRKEMQEHQDQAAQFTSHPNETNQLEEDLDKLSAELNVVKEGLDKMNVELNSLISSISSIPQREESIIGLLEQVTASTTESGLKEKLDAIISTLAEMKLVSTAATQVSTKRDMVAYNAAIDAWKHIHDHLASLGKDRWKIQHVYQYLAGQDVSQEVLQTDLIDLSNDRKEEVITIIDDIRRFMAIHRKAIDDWLQDSTDPHIRSLCDAVRMPLGLPFDADYDEELTGDSVEDGAIVTKVASLGYYFPESRNGGFRQKSKVIVASS